ncbi:MAG: hypothetical protein ACFFB3_01990 [Candidatus Hodarchaeota archaeon]
MTRLDLIRDSLQELLSSYIPITVVIKNKKLHLSEETLQTIQDAESAIAYAIDSNLPLPRSTYEFCHYGTAIRDKIFLDIEEYQVEQSKKRRARRKGSWQLKMIGWNEKKINFDIKKYPEPEWEGKKPEKDEKVFRRLMKDWPAEVNKQFLAECESKIRDLVSIFVNPASKTTQKVKELELALKNYWESKELYREEKEKLKNARMMHEKLLKTVQDLTDKSNALKARIDQLPEQKDLMIAQNELQKLLEERKIRSFLKIWRDLLHRYIRWAQKELGSQLPLKDLISIEKDFLDLSVPLEELYDEISVEFVTRAEVLYAQRKQFSQKVGSSEQLKGRLENGKKTIFELRKLQKRIDDSQKKLNAMKTYQEAKEINRRLDEEKEEFSASERAFQNLERLASKLKTQRDHNYEILQRKIRKK